ncbi:MAG: hypothetical protein ACRD0A_12315, partial [Acidimicrobiales bacterium]
AAVDRAAAGLDDDRHRLVRLEARRTRVGLELDDARRAATEAESAAPDLAATETAAHQARADADRRLGAAEDGLRAAEAGHHRWAARADTLAQALDAARARAGAERLAGLDGVCGSLLELVEVDAGFEAAFEAAVGEAMVAVVVESVPAARRAVEALRSGDVAGAVLPLAARSAARPEPPRGALRGHVRSSRPAVEDLLDVLIGSAVVVDGGWEAAIEVAVEQPGTIVVTTDGDRFAATGWRVGNTAVGATGAALDEARANTEEAAATLAGAHTRVESAARQADECRRVAAEASARRAEHEHVRTAASETVGRLERQRAEITDEVASYRARIEELVDGLAHDRERVASLEASLATLEADEAADTDRRQAEAEARQRLTDDLGALASRRADLDVRMATVDERRTQARRRLDEIDERLARLGAERTEAVRRRDELDATANALTRLAAAIGERLRRIEGELGELRRRRQQQTDATRLVAARLDDLRRRRTAEEAELEAIRERSRRAELDEAETRLRLEQAIERCRHDLDVDPAQAEAATCPPRPEGVSAQARTRELERELRLMGPVNPLAVEEHQALQERHEFVTGQLDDVRDSRRELAKIIRSVDEEIVNVFAAAYADVAENFARLFETLFPGGRGRLSLTRPDDRLDTGIEVEARPSGKNVKKLSLLSGGERSLTALAFLFAVFRSRPSPFYVLDEVEAALDDVNLHRFLDLVAEFRREAQLLIVSHQKRTMEAADCLYGVTLQAGSSRVISERVAAHA